VAAVTTPGRVAADVVKVRLSGYPDEAAAVAAALASLPGVQVLTGPDGPYPNRRQPGHRLYLTVRLTEPPGAATAHMEGTPR
jgi:hypothetical protein